MNREERHALLTKYGHPGIFDEINKAIDDAPDPTPDVVAVVRRIVAPTVRRLDEAQQWNGASA